MRSIKKQLIKLGIIFLVPGLGLAAPKKKDLESYLAAISRAQELLLNQKRTQATQVLVQEVEKERSNQKAIVELKKALNNLSEMFLTEKAQRVFELGRSLSAEEIDAGSEKYLEALALEPSNLKIIKELARNFLVKKECIKALEYAKEALLLNPYSAEFFLIKLQAKACLGKIEDIEAELANPHIDKLTIEPYLDFVVIQHLFNQEKYLEALDTLNKLKPTKQPEFYYWKGMVKTKLGQSPVLEFERYIDLCKDSKSKTREKFPQEPRTCKEQKAIEVNLEKLKSEG